MEGASLMAEGKDERSTRAATTRYGDDAHAWALEQSAFLRDGRFGDLDLVNLADEVAVVVTDLPDEVFLFANPYSCDEIMTRPVEWPDL